MAVGPTEFGYPATPDFGLGTCLLRREVAFTPVTRDAADRWPFSLQRVVRGDDV
jgi:hypothetical protein